MNKSIRSGSSFKGGYDFNNNNNTGNARDMYTANLGANGQS